MQMFDELNALGADLNSALARFMGNTSLLEMILKKTPESIEKNGDVVEQIDAGNIDAAILKAHTLKGNMGNLSITPLYEAYTEITELLRSGKTDEAREKTLAIQPLQQKVIDTIKRYS